jgi:NTE family protein
MDVVVTSAAASSVVQAIARIGRVFSSIDEDVVRASGLFDRIRKFPLFEECDDAAVERIAAEATWFGLPGGVYLDRDGENDEAIFLVVSGRLAVHVADDKGIDRVVAHVPAGETVGEMSLIAGDAHSAKLRAMRDSELLRLSKAAFLRITAREPRVMTTLTRLIIRRLRATTARNAALMRPKTFALIPLDHDADALAFGRGLTDMLGSMGVKCVLFDPSHHDEPAENQSNAEQNSDMVVYVGDEPGSAWSQHCIRQADRVMLLSHADGAAQSAGFQQAAAGGRRYELIVLHGAANDHAAQGGVTEGRHNMRHQRREDVARLARLMTGRAVGVVLAGGGARGYAHIGAIRALREAGVKIDMAGGASIGAIIAAGLAMDWSDDEVEERMRRTFVRDKPLNDYTLPFVALLRGGKVARQLQGHFGEMRIEDMPLPFFAMTSDLTSGHAVAHRSGLLWRTLKASVSIPGLLPPVVMGGHLHVDGGIMNNLPVDVMAAEARGAIVAIDVVGEAGIAHHDENFGDNSWFGAWWRRRKGAPTLASILLRAGTVGNEMQRRVARTQADLIIDPPLDGIGLTHWKKFDAAVEAGYRAVAKVLDEKGLPAVLKSAA